MEESLWVLLWLLREKPKSVDKVHSTLLGLKENENRGGAGRGGAHFHFVREWFKEQLCQIQIELLAAVRMDKWSNGGGGCSFGSFAPDLDRLATNISINQSLQIVRWCLSLALLPSPLLSPPRV